MELKSTKQYRRYDPLHHSAAGLLNEREHNALSPLQIYTEHCGLRETHTSVCSDQSGIIGLIRHLHNLGLLFFAVRRAHTGQPERKPYEANEEKQ